jgi:hypothetical protein
MSDNMCGGYARIAVVVAAIIAVAAVAYTTNIQTTLGQQKGSPAVNSITMQVYFKPEGTVSTWSMGVSKGSTLCPSGDCRYSIEDTYFTPSYRGGYTFTGLLKVSVVSNNTINSKFYPMRAELDKIGSEERGGQITEFLGGTIGFGGDMLRCIGCRPEFEYKVDNATLLVNPSAPVLTLQGSIHNTE